MRWHYYFLVFCILVLSCTPSVAELIPAYSTVSVSASPEWVVANGSDTTTITAEIKSNNIPVPNLTVDFAVDDPTKGSVFPTRSTTNGNGNATTIFQSKTVSGTANVTATVHYTYGGIPGILAGSGIVKIDHDTPYSFRILLYYPTATVGSLNWTNMSMQDRWGNLVDNRNENEIEEVEFSLITVDDESRLWNFSESNFSNKKTTVPVGNDGMVRANITLGTQPGETHIRIKPPNIRDQTIKIERVADGEPWYIYAVRRDPSVPFVPANGNESFVITYQLFDQYWNVLNNKNIELTVTSPGEPWFPNLTTTYNGLAASRYGPFPLGPGTGKIFSTNLIATAQENRSVQTILPVEFYDPEPNDLLLTVSPKNMPSLDVNGTSKAIITGTVIDYRGRGVKNETIYFSISPSTYSVVNPKVLAGPSISNNSAISYEGDYPVSGVTGNKGFTYITFIPGELNETFRPVTGECTITASWRTKIKTVIPTWKNYGYLRVTTISDYDPQTNLSVNQTVNLSVEVYADGPSFTSRPIDMILNLDRGAKMLLDTYNAGNSGSVHDKMVYVYEYSGVLLEELIECPEEQQCDRAGVVSFGPGMNSTKWPDKLPGEDNTKNDDTQYKNSWYPPPYTGYEDWATIDTGLVYDFDPVVEDVVNDTKPFGDPWKGDKQNVPMRYGLYKAINEMIGLGESSPRPNAIRAIVLLTDTEWNDWGDPSAGWDGTSVKTNLAVPITKKAPWDLSQGGLSQWTPFDWFGENVNGNMTAIPASISDPRQNMANYAKAHDIIIYSVAYPKKDTNIETSRERVLRDLANTTGGMYFEARSGTNLKEIFEYISRDLRQRASINTTAEFNFSKIRLNADPNDTNLTEGYKVFDYVNNSQSTFIQKWNNSNSYYPGYPEHRNDTENWTTNQKLIFDLGTMYKGDRWLVNFTLRSKIVAAVEIFENSYIYSDNDEIVVPEAVIVVDPITYGDVPTSDLGVTLDVTDSMNAKYSITYTGEKKVHARLYFRKSGDVMGDWKQFAAQNYLCPGHTCYAIFDEKQLNKWALGSGKYMLKIEAWADDAPLDIDVAGPVNITNKYFILLR